MLRAPVPINFIRGLWPFRCRMHREGCSLRFTYNNDGNVLLNLLTVVKLHLLFLLSAVLIQKYCPFNMNSVI